MRAFRLKKRNIATNQVENQRDYIGIENLERYAPETWERYEAKWLSTKKYNPELYEKVGDKWVLRSNIEALELMKYSNYLNK